MNRNLSKKAMAKRREEKRKRMTRPPGIPEKIERKLDLPPGTLSHASRMEIIGNRRAVMEGKCEILEYDENVIRLDNAGSIVQFTGSNMMMCCMNEDYAIVEGVFSSVEFIG